MYFYSQQSWCFWNRYNVAWPCRPQLYAVLGSLPRVKLSDPHRTAMVNPNDSASTVTSFHFSHFFCFVISFEFVPKRTPFYCFISSNTASLFVVANLPFLAFHYPTCHTSRWYGNWRQVYQNIPWNSIWCYLSLVATSPLNLSLVTSVAKWNRLLETTGSNIQETVDGIRSNTSSGNACCYYNIRKLTSSNVLSKALKIKFVGREAVMLIVLL
jgi:hypothetical protein